MNTGALKVFLLGIIVVFFYSCGSQKKVVTSKKVITKPKPVVVAPTIPKKETPKEVIAIEEPVVVTPVPEVETSKPKSIGDIRQEYILTFADKAVDEMHKHKIPASITLAQGVLESGSGRSELALKSNNHFGIKCHKGWKGNRVSHDDDAKGECFRKYQDPRKSYEDHSAFLTSRKRYAGLFRLRPTDFTGWAYGLKKAGYATDPRYPQKLITIINTYKLYEYDLIENPYTHNEVSEIQTITASYYTVKKGDTLYSIAKRNKMSVEQLKAKNGLIGNTIVIGQELIIN